MSEVHELSALERLRSKKTSAAVCHLIDQNGGWIPFDRYMELVLYDPELGYYSACDQQFGAGGDFVTAPVISDLFGQAIAGQLSRLIGQIPQAGVIEHGAGNGQLALQVLKELERVGRTDFTYRIVEKSPALRKRQQQVLGQQLPQWAGRIEWVDEQPDNFNGVVVANELLDALPIRRIRKFSGGYEEMGVVHHQGQLQCEFRLVHEQEILNRLEPLQLADGYLTEIGLEAERWVRSVASSISCGALLLIDYGYGRREFYHPQRSDGTFLCYFRHTAADNPLILPGLQDLTAHVDFTAIAEAGEAGGMHFSGFTSQAQFLLASEVVERLGLGDGESMEHLQQIAGLKQLLHPGGMGEVFKIIGFTSAADNPIDWGRARSLAHTL